MELRTFLYSQAIVTIAVLTFDVCSFVFYGLALQFPAEQFAEVAAMSALNFVITVVAATMGTYVVMRSKERQIGGLSVEGMRLGISAALLLALGFAVISPLLKEFFHFHSSVPFIILGISAVPAVMFNVLQSLLLAKRRFWLLAVGLIAFGIGRIPSGYFLFSDGFASTDAPLAILISALIGLLVTIAGNGNLLHRSSFLPILPTARQTRDILALLWSIFVVGALLKVDILWAKHSLPSDEAGMYGMTSLIASVLYFVSLGALRPTLAYVTKKNLRRMALLSGGIILVLCAMCIVGYYLIGQFIFALITDHAKDIMPLPLLLLFIGMTGYSLLSLGMQCLGVLHKTVHVKLMTAVVLGDFILLFFFGKSTLEIAFVQMTALLLGAIAAAVFVFSKKTAS